MNALLVATLQVSVILLTALGLAGLLHRKAAVLRHAVIAIGMGCAAIVPLLDAFLPNWLAAPALPGIERAMAVAPLQPAPATPEVTSAQTAPIASPPSGATEVRGELQAAQGGDAAGELPGERARGALSLAGLVTSIYLAGLMLALSLLAFELLWIWWVSMRAAPLRSPEWHRQLAVVSNRYGLRRNVRLRHVRHATLLATWGFIRPQVLLPTGVEAWPEQRIRAVLLHELAHVRRNDWLIQVLAAVLRAVYWFNPLVWIACHRLQQHSELACDDAVIGDGIGATEYASELLAVARGMAGRPLLLGPAPSMARRSTLQRRVARILDTAVDRAQLRGGLLGCTVLSLLVVTCAVAACGSRQQTSPAASATSPPRGATAADDRPTEVPEADPGPVAQTSAPLEEASQPAPVAVVAPAGVDSPASPQKVSPQQVVADILGLVNAALADESTAVLDEITYPITGLHHVQRYAEAVVRDDGADPAALTANCIEIINALVNTGNAAANAGLRPRAAQLPVAALAQLSGKLHASAAALKEALLPVPAVASSAPSTTERRAAAAARNLARETLRDVAFVGPRQGSWLVTELDTLERAASSVVHDSGADAQATRLKLHALRSSLRSVDRQFRQFAGRQDRAPANRDKAATLVASLADVGTRLDAAISGQQGVSIRDPLAAVVARAAEDVAGLQLVTLRRSADTFIATLGNGGPGPINILIEDAPTEAEAARKEELAVLGAAAAGTLRERNGVPLNTWGEEGADTGYRVLARVGTRVVNISAPGDMSTFVLPVLDRIIAQIR